MKRHDKAPNGHFAEGLILYGNLETGGSASKGFILEPPDLHNASVALLNEFQDKIRVFLSTLSNNQRAQLQWTCNSDYKKELVRYHEETAKGSNDAIKRVRNERFSRYWQRMLHRTLRREQLVLFISQDIESYSGSLKTRAGLFDYYEKTLKQLKSDFAEIGTTLTTIFGNGTTLEPMGDLDHFAYYSLFLNPTLADRFELNLEDLYHRNLTLQELCWHGDGVGLNEKIGFYLDSHYHNIFSLKRWPQKTYPSLIHRLTSLPFLDYQITINLEPIPVRHEIAKEEKAMDRLRGDLREEGKQSIAVALKKKERKIDSSLRGFRFRSTSSISFASGTALKPVSSPRAPPSAMR